MKLSLPESDLLSKALSLLDPRDRRLYLMGIVLQLALAVLDLFGVLLLGMVGVILASAASGAPVPPPFATTLEWLGVTSNPTPSTALTLAAIAAVLLVLKSSLALVVQTKILRFLGRRAGAMGSQIARRFFGLPLLAVRAYPSQATAFALIEGVSGLVNGILGSYMIVASETALLTVLGLALVVVDPVTTVVAVAYFAVVATLLGRWLGRLSRSAGRVVVQSSIAARTVAQDAVDTYPEITVMHRRGFFVKSFAVARSRFAAAQAEAMVLSTIPRYGMEAALVVGAALMAGTLLVTNDVVGAVGGIVLFLAAASRVVPAMLRLNSAVITIRNQAEAANRLIALNERISTSEVNADTDSMASNHQPSSGALPTLGADLVLSSVSLTYPGRSDPSLEDVSLDLPAGKSLALVGPSGAGKSSLVAVVLGLLEPTSGTVRIAGTDPRELVRTVSGVIGYVPQDVALVSGSIRDNVALGLPPEGVDDELVWEALRRSRLADFVATLPDKLETAVGERGMRMSGGQRQRLGLARALYFPPRLLVLDEATSALDAETEEMVGATIAALDGKVTTITVAHRLATVRQANVVAYIDNGRVLAQGSFDELRSAVPAFERQANLLGM